MKKAHVLILVAVVLVIGGGIWMLLSGEAEVAPAETQTFTETPVETAAAPEVLSGQNTLKALLGLGKTLECSFQFKDGVQKSEGTGFFDGGKMRVDSFYTASSGEIYTANMINDGATMYVWSNTEDGQFAMKMSATTAGGGTAATGESTQSLNADTAAWYTCKPWNVDGSVFEPPRDIQFMDMQSLLQGLPAGVSQ